MAFPTTAVLDTFDRANEGPPPSANWTSDLAGLGHGGLKVSANTCIANIAGNCSGYWSASTFGPDAEAYVKVPTIGGQVVRLYLRLAAPGTAGVDGYFALFNAAFGAVQAFRTDNQINTQLGSDIALTFVDGDIAGVGMVGATFASYKNGVLLDTRSDSTYTAAGNIGLLVNGNSIVLDDFGGGTVPLEPGTIGSFPTAKMRSRRTSW